MKHWVCVSTLVLVGCVESLDEAATSQEITEANGVSLNGVSLNGVPLNGVSLNGVSLNGVSLNGVSLNGVSLNGVSLNGVSLNGVSLNGTSLAGTRSDTGEALTLPVGGVGFTGLLSNGATIALHVDGAAPLTGANSDITAYTISYATDAGTFPLCDGANEALALAGTWSTQAGVPGGGAYTAADLTFACRGKTIAKCVELGYKQARGYQTQLESCVRALRGDYCGDGTPYTVTGHLVNLFDSAGVQTDTELLWVPEAEWTPAGARCISSKRETRFYENGLVPTCLLKKTKTLSVTTSCATSFSGGAALITELPIVATTSPSSLVQVLKAI
jgi:hypothetical protein